MKREYLLWAFISWAICAINVRLNCRSTYTSIKCRRIEALIRPFQMALASSLELILCSWKFAPHEQAPQVGRLIAMLEKTSSRKA